jgi:hypothetical protein
MSARDAANTARLAAAARAKAEADAKAAADKAAADKAAADKASLDPTKTPYADLTPAQRAAMTSEEKRDYIKAAREAEMAADAAARAETDPMKNFQQRPDAPPADENYLYYYSWVGGVNSGSWELYRAPNDTANNIKYGSRTVGGETQASATSAVGANALKNQPKVDPKTGVVTTTTTTTPTTTTPTTGDAAATAAAAKAAADKAAADAAAKAAADKAAADAAAKAAADKAAADKAAADAAAAGGKGLSKAEIDAAIAAAVKAATAGTVSKSDLDSAIAKATAEAEARAKATARELKAAEDAKALAVKMKASDRLSALFASYGLESLAGFISRRIMADASEDMIMLEMYDQPEYQLRFPGMKALRAKGKTITEGEYIKDEKAFTQTARFFDVPVGFYDSPDDFGKLIGNLVSPKEFQDRLQVGQDLARSMSPGIRTQLQELYNVGEGGITAYVLDADRALPLIQKQAKAAQFVGFGREKGFKLEGITAAQAEQLAGTEAYAKLSAQQLQIALGQAAQLRQTQTRLTGIEGGTYDESQALKAVIEGSPEALLASQQRAQREGARFGAGGGAGITGSSLRSTPGI